jgi:hypothetical protein
MPRPTAAPKVALDGESYTFGYLPTSQALGVAIEVAQRFMPSIGALLPKGEGLAALFDKDMKEALGKLDLAGGLVVLAASMEPDACTTLIKKLNAVVVVDGVGLLDDTHFDEHYKGRPGLALKVAAKSFEVSCADFFAHAVSLVGFLKPKASTPA